MKPGDGQLSLQLLQTDGDGKHRTTQTAPRRPMLPRLSVSPDEAAQMLGVSRDYLDEHILRELRSIRRGRRVLIAVQELERWLNLASARRSA